MLFGKRVINQMKRNASINRSELKSAEKKRGNNTLHKWPSPTHAGFQNVDIENTQDPIFSCTVTLWQMCTQDLETAAIFSWTALLSKTRLWRFWLGCSLWGGGERARGVESGRVGDGSRGGRVATGRGGGCYESGWQIMISSQVITTAI